MAHTHFMQVSRWLGHSTFTLTLNTYSDWIPEEDGGAVNHQPEPTAPVPGTEAVGLARLDLWRDGWRLWCRSARRDPWRCWCAELPSQPGQVSGERVRREGPVMLSRPHVHGALDAIGAADSAQRVRRGSLLAGIG